MDSKLQGNVFFVKLISRKKLLHGVKKQEILLDDDIVSSHFDKIVL